VLREIGVRVGVIGVEQIGDRPVGGAERVEEYPHLVAHCLPQFRRERGEEFSTRPRFGELLELQPLFGERIGERFRLRLFEHPQHLSVEHRGLAQFALISQSEQFRVRHARPQEIRQARREFVVADAVRALFLRAVALDAEQEVRRHQHRFEYRFQRVLELRPVFGSLVEQCKQSLDGLRFNWPAVRAAHQLRYGAFRVARRHDLLQ